MRRLLLPLLLLGCQPDPSKARGMLSSIDPVKRQEGASVLQRVYAKDPKSLGDHGEAYWAARLERVVGAPSREAMRILEDPQSTGSEGGGGGATENYRLDDFWTTALFRDTRNDTIFGHDPPRRNVVHVDMLRPPPRFTGTWTTYYVNGAIYEAFELEGGVPRRDRVYHDNGKLRYERVYVDGKVDGTVVTRSANGAPEWEDTYAKGKQVGAQKWFYPDGKLRQEGHYADDKLDGRMRNFSESGAVTFCAEYRAGVELDGGCDPK